MGLAALTGEKHTAHSDGGLMKANADDYLYSMVKYLIEKSEIPNRDVFYHWVQSHLSPQLETRTMATLAEQWKMEGEIKGRMEGRMEGALIGERRLLITQLNRRFSHLAKQYQDKINQADEKALQLWGEKILEAKAIVIAAIIQCPKTVDGVLH